MRLLFASIIAFILCSVFSVKSNENKTDIYYSTSDQQLTIESMTKIITFKLSDREGIDEKNREELFEAFLILGIKTAGDIEKLFEEYLIIAFEDEQRICKEMLISYEENGELMSKDSYSAEIEDLENIKQGKYFTQSGIVRSMLIMKYGEENNGIIRGENLSDFDDDEYIETSVESVVE